eukprot:UN10475
MVSEFVKYFLRSNDLNTALFRIVTLGSKLWSNLGGPLCMTSLNLSKSICFRSVILKFINSLALRQISTLRESGSFCICKVRLGGFERS